MGVGYPSLPAGPAYIPAFLQSPPAQPGYVPQPQPSYGYQPDAYMPAAYQPLDFSSQLAALEQQLAQLASQVQAFMQPLWPYGPIGQVPPPPPLPPAPPPPPAWPPAPPAPPPPQPQPQPAPGGHRPTQFVLSSFNVLGSSHTEKGGEKPWMASGPQRIHTVVRLLDQHHVDVAGLQEFQSNQCKEFQRIAGNRYAVYPGNSLRHGDSQNSITWRKDTWDLVNARTFEIPYFEGHKARQPVVLLRNKQTGQEAYFLNVHNPADTAKHHHQGAYRTRATEIESALIAQLRQSGKPVFLTGDLNEHEAAFQQLQHHGALVTANSAKTRQHGIDWIVGTPGVHFSKFLRDRSKTEATASDHPMVAATVEIPG